MKPFTSLRRAQQLLARLFIAGLVLAFLPAASLAQADLPLHPQLVQWSEATPNAQVSVIVQKQGDANLEQAVARLGGSITQDLSIINAFAAELPARNLARLARMQGVRWISPNAAVEESGGPCKNCIDTSALLDVYTQSIGASKLWNEKGYLQGQGVTVAVVDSGVAPHNDLASAGKNGKSADRILDSAKFNTFTNSASDGYGHGTHIAGIIAGNGSRSKGARMGVAPGVNLVNVKVSDDRGAGTTADLVAGLQWVLQNKDQHNIRVVNLSLNSSVAESYLTNPISAAVEILWFNGIVVVVSAGNNGGSDNGILYPPANDPFVITVGATDDRGTVDTADDVVAGFSAYGTTADGFAKPEIVAPGTNIISLLASNGAELVKGHPKHRVDGFAGGKDYYFRISGTSMSSAVVAGSVALLLQDEPGLTPDQVKHRLMATARPVAGAPAGSTGAGMLDIYAAVHGKSTESANSGVQANNLLWSGSEPVVWNSVNWNSVNWNSVNWNSVNWNSVNWNSVNWNSLYWDD